MDTSREPPDNLPELKPGDAFCFNCTPHTPCFNRCCAELALPLTPYDCLRLRRHFNAVSDDLLRRFTTMRRYPDTGFPLPMLRMLDGPGEPCPFVTPAGCSVYKDRPGACRCYPLGRGAAMGKTGVDERVFVVREDHCLGFDHGDARTPMRWFAEQEVTAYNASNDRYMRLMTLTRATGKPLDPRLASMSLLCLFQLDKFRELITRMGIFDRVEADDRQDAIMEDSLAGDEAALDFALDWVELAIFGVCPTLCRTQNHD
ncbi:MAG: YkgJ family cysteine cluster protein [Desulfovibrio sp.]|nr:YkgJ family cysteine cluster protein [Desulfovibrio sp.]